MDKKDSPLEHQRTQRRMVSLVGKPQEEILVRAFQLGSLEGGKYQGVQVIVESADAHFLLGWDFAMLAWTTTTRILTRHSYSFDESVSEQMQLDHRPRAE